MHGVVICEGIVSMEVLRSHNDAYLLYQSIILDDPQITKIDDVVGGLFCGPQKGLRHSPKA